MKIAIFSDIHGNLEALVAVLQDIAARKCDLRYCLGDIVGYGANPTGTLITCFDALSPRRSGSQWMTPNWSPIG
jgi:hypothetical protein